MTKATLTDTIFKTGSYLCVGLDTDITKIPAHLHALADPVFEFNKAIIDATLPHCVAYKINTAFYEPLGAQGWETMQKTFEYIPSSHFKIADAKRGDIGNTSTQYAKAMFEQLGADAVTVSPYMGIDSVTPFLQFKDTWTIILALTSNEGSLQFQQQPLQNGTLLYEQVLLETQKWGTDQNIMYVVGATNTAYFDAVRALAPEHFLLVPGVGAQGGDLKAVSEKCLTTQAGILVNSSRAIIYASGGSDFAIKAKAESLKVQHEMKQYLDLFCR